MSVGPWFYNGSGDFMQRGNFSSASFNNTYAYTLMFAEESSTEKQLSEEVVKILDDIDSGKVNMVTETASEFITNMNRDLSTEKDG
jgi:hypothetical protein